MENQNGKPGGSSPADRRMFIKTVAGSALATGLVAAAGKAEAAPVCGQFDGLPVTAVKARVVFNAKLPPTLEQLHKALDELIRPSGCPNCGLGGIIKDLGIIRELVLDTGYLGDSEEPFVLVQDFGAQGF